MKKISAMNDDEDDDESYQPFPIQRHFIEQCNRKNVRDRCKWPRDEGRWVIDDESDSEENDGNDKNEHL